MGEQMPKEQYEFIEGIKHKMLDASNMKESEAWDFAFRVYQFDDFLRNYLNKDLIIPYQDMKTDEYRHLIKKKVG